MIKIIGSVVYVSCVLSKIGVSRQQVQVFVSWKNVVVICVARVVVLMDWVGQTPLVF